MAPGACGEPNRELWALHPTEAHVVLEALRIAQAATDAVEPDSLLARSIARIRHEAREAKEV